MVNFGPLTAEIGWRVWGTPANFNRFRIMASLMHRRRSTEINQTLHDVWPSPGLVYYAYIFGALAPNGILPGAIFALRPSFAFSYIGRVTARHLLNNIQQKAPPLFGGRPSRWAWTHILVCLQFSIYSSCFLLVSRSRSRFSWLPVSFWAHLNDNRL